jgi:hypothetical protein
MIRKVQQRILATLFVLCLVGCGAVHPPAHLVDPVKVYVADYGVHSAVMLPVGGDLYIEYAFGDWGYCAENRIRLNDALGALLVSNGSAFGRRYIQMKPGQAYPIPGSPLPKTIFPVAVSRHDVEAVENELAARYKKYECTKVHNPDNDTDYVRDDQHYSFLHSCNHLTAQTLRELCCQVDGPTIFSSFHLAGTPAKDCGSCQNKAK